MGASNCRASACLPWPCHSRARLMAARSSSDFASWRRATSRARCNPGFPLRQWWPRLPQEHDAPEAMDFRFPPAFLLLLHQGMGLGQRLEAVLRGAQVGTDVRQQGTKVWDVERLP